MTGEKKEIMIFAYLDSDNAHALSLRTARFPNLETSEPGDNAPALSSGPSPGCLMLPFFILPVSLCQFCNLSRSLAGVVTCALLCKSWDGTWLVTPFV